MSYTFVNTETHLKNKQNTRKTKLRKNAYIEHPTSSQCTDRNSQILSAQILRQFSGANLNRVKNGSKVNVLQKLNYQSPSDGHVRSEIDSLRSQVVQVKAMNHKLIKSMNVYKTKYENEITSLRDEVKSHKQTSLDNTKKGVEQQNTSLKKVEDLQQVILQLKSQLHIKEYDCQQEVKQISRALRNVQHKHLIMQMRHNSLIKKTHGLQKQVQKLGEKEKKLLAITDALKKANKYLKVQLNLKEQQYNEEIKRVGEVVEDINRKTDVSDSSDVIWLPPVGSVPIDWPNSNEDISEFDKTVKTNKKEENNQNEWRQKKIELEKKKFDIRKISARK